MTANWDLRRIDTAGLLGALSFPLLVGPIALAVVGQANTGALLACASWFIVMSYESGMVESVKAEVFGTENNRQSDQ